MGNIVLRYIGHLNHGAFIFGVPRCDLTAAMVDECGLSVEELLAYFPPVYERVEQSKQSEQDEAAQQTQPTSEE